MKSARPASLALAPLALALAVLAALAAAPALAQSTSPVDGITPLGLSPGRPAGSFPLSGFEAVNLFNGNLDFASGDGTEHDFRDDVLDGQVRGWSEGQAPTVRGARWHSTDGTAASLSRTSTSATPATLPAAPPWAACAW